MALIGFIGFAVVLWTCGFAMGRLYGQRELLPIIAQYKELAGDAFATAREMGDENFALREKLERQRQTVGTGEN